MLGYSRRGSHHASSFDLFPHPDDLDQTREDMRQLMAGERDFYDHDKRCIRKDGEVISVHVRAWLEPQVEGEPRTAIAMIENINERKLAEIALRENSERLERIVETQRDIAAAGVDLEGVMELIVERSKALTGGRGRDGQPHRRRRPGRRRRGRRCARTSSAPAARSRSRSSSTRSPRATRSSSSTPRRPAPLPRLAPAVRDRSHICVPLFHGDRPVGAPRTS